MARIDRPPRGECADYYYTYIDRVPDGDVVEHLAVQRDRTAAILGRVDAAKETFRYSAGKWSVREVVGHMIDTERVFTGRALAIARRDPADQPSMDQDLWMANAGFDRRTLASLAAELLTVRDATMSLLRSFDDEVVMRLGRASGNPFRVRGLVWTIAGHELHHLATLAERYGVR
ncbi:MAG: DinB family protein [Planctomycetota bacterium]